MNRLSHVCSVHLNVETEKLWDLLINPKYTEKYMFNCRVISDFKVGSGIDWKGSYNGVEAFLTGEVLAIKPQKMLKYSIVDPSLHDPKVPENYVHVTYEIRPQNGGMLLTVVNETFDGDEERMKHVSAGWEAMVFPEIKKLI